MSDRPKYSDLDKDGPMKTVRFVRADEIGAEPPVPFWLAMLRIYKEIGWIKMARENRRLTPEEHAEHDRRMDEARRRWLRGDE